MRQTGGSELGLISTKSTPSSNALFKASCKDTIPICSLLISFKRTFLARISPFIR